MEQHDFFQQVLTSFSAGLLTSLTPCVYPLIPITLALFGADGSSSRIRAFFLSLSFVFGISVTFTSLGLLAASSGALFGSSLSHPLVLVALACLFLVLALNSIEIFELPFLHKVQGAASKIGGVGFTGAFLAGSVSGLVAAPCVSPPLVAILAFVANTGDLQRGFWLLLAYSFGLGVLFLVLGTFSGLVNRIPRSGTWMYGVKFLIGSALVFAVFFTLQPILPIELIEEIREGLNPILFGALILCLGLAWVSYKRELKSIRLIASLVLALSLFVLVLVHPAVKELHWYGAYSEGTEVAAKTDTPLMIDMYADWCAACKELDAITFRDPRVMSLLKGFTLIRLDLTSPTEADQEIMDRFEVVGLPWIVFLRSTGSQISDTTITGFLPPEEFAHHLSEVLKKKDLE